MDWAAWSRECVTLISARARDLLERHQLADGVPYRWDLDNATFSIGGMTLGLVTVGTLSGGSFRWSWANEAIPAHAKVGVDQVRQFGIDNDLALLVEPCTAGGMPQAHECLAIAARLLDADGIWIDATDGAYILFALKADIVAAESGTGQ